MSPASSKSFCMQRTVSASPLNRPYLTTAVQCCIAVWSKDRSTSPPSGLWQLVVWSVHHTSRWTGWWPRKYKYENIVGFGKWLLMAEHQHSWWFKTLPFYVINYFTTTVGPSSLTSIRASIVTSVLCPPSLQGLLYGCTCRWLPSGTRMTRWSCSSAPSGTSPCSSSPWRTRSPQKVCGSQPSLLCSDDPSCPGHFRMDCSSSIFTHLSCLCR